MPRALHGAAGAGAVPACVLVHGSGPNDADETIGGARVFKDLAWGLASQGVAVLRYAKRSKHAPQGIVTQKEEVLDAAHAAADLLRKTPGIDPKRVFVVGHSQGGYLAPRIAKDDPALAGIALLAGAARPLEDSIIDQLTYFASLDPKNAAIEKALAGAHEFKVVAESPTLTPDADVRLPIGGGSVKGAYLLDVRGYDPVAVAKGLACRVLVLQGGRDYQVTPVGDFARWKTLAGAKNVTFKTYPTLNHLFVAGEGPPGPTEYEKDGHVDAAVVADLAVWMREAR
jgi:dienelactone hydrolase